MSLPRLEEHHSWIDGRTICRKRIEVKECKLCESHSNLIVHHIIPARYELGIHSPKEGIHTPDNLMVLCKSCHKKEHDKLRPLLSEEEKKRRKNEYNKKYYNLHKDNIKAHLVEYYQKNKSKILRKQKEYYTKNRENILEHERERYAQRISV